MKSTTNKKRDNWIQSRLLKFDGKKTAVLEAILLEIEPVEGASDELLDLVSSKDANLSIGSTWLLKALLETGLSLEPSMVATLGRSLDSVSDDWASLHICQSMQFFAIPRSNAGQFARFLERCQDSGQKFLRAWSLDGFWQLAKQHDRYLPRAITLVQEGTKHPAASVRARARNIQKEMDRA